MEIKNAVCYSFSLNDEGPLAYIRLIGPLKQSGINIVNGIENNQININRVSEGNVVIIQREFPWKFDSYEKIIEIAHKEGKPVVFDLDDLLFCLPENHPDRQSAVYGPSLLPMFQALMEADLVSVSTPKLRDFVINYNDNVAVLPNYFDDNLWQLKPPDLKTSEHETITIGYMGGNSHKPDLEYITPVLLDLIKRYPKKIRFQFWGVRPPVEVASLTQLHWSPAPTYKYKDFATFFQAQTADILISPLIDNLFNRCKSPIKFFEYSALGVPGVFSCLETYTDVITHGHNGLLASSLDEWTNCLIQLIEDEELRFNIAINAQKTIRSNWLLSQNSNRWQETYQNVFVNSSSNRGQKDKTLQIIKSTNHQLIESSLLKEAEVQTLTAQVAEKEQSVQALSAQVAEKEQSVQTLSAHVAEKEQSVQVLTVQVAEKEQSVQILTAQMAEKEQSVQILTAQMAEKEQSVQALTAQVAEKEQKLAEIINSKAWEIALLFRRTRVLLAPPNSRRARVLRFLIAPIVKVRMDWKLKKDMTLMRSSGLFDKAWYLASYPDIAEAKIDPEFHYLLYGGFEGRDPGPNFSSKWYLDNYADVLAAKMNPLVYYLRYVRKEERPLKPSLIKILHFLRRGFLFFWKLKGIVFFAGYPYPEREKDGYYQRIRSVDTIFNDRWRVYIDNVRLPGRETWCDRPAPFTLVLRPNGSGEREWVKRLCIVLCVLRCRVIYFHSVLSIGTIDFLWRLPRITKIIDLHGVVPEEFRYQGDLVNAEHFDDIERAAVSKAQYIIVVSEAMRYHIEEKYPGIIEGQFITLPIFQGISVDRSEKPYINGKPVIIYAGGLQKWQQVPKMINAMSSTIAFFRYKFFCPEPKEVLAVLPENLRDKPSLEIDSKPFGEIFQVYHNCHYGFILREDIIVNHVACPTKLIEYLAMGIVPIVDCEDIGDFKVMGMQFVHFDDLLNNRLPDESTRKVMANTNFGVFAKLLDKYDVGVSALQQSVSFSKLSEQEKSE